MPDRITRLNVGHLLCVMDRGQTHYQEHSPWRPDPLPPRPADLSAIPDLPSAMDNTIPAVNQLPAPGAGGMLGGTVTFERLDMAAGAGAGYVEADCLYANAEPFWIDYTVWDDAKEQYVRRLASAQLKVDSDTVFSAYDINSPAGLPVGWRHNLWDRNPVGRVMTMGITDDGAIVGRIKLSLAEMSAAMSGGIADFRAGMNRGLSIGFQALDPVEVEVNEGDMDSPDRIHYGRISIYEVSVTPLPRLPDAGILAIAADGEGGDDMGDDTDTEPAGDAGDQKQED